MINYYDGTPGSGKSYHAVDEIVKALKAGKNVITDIAVDLNGYVYRRGKKKHYKKKPIKYTGRYIHMPIMNVPFLYKFTNEYTHHNNISEHEHLVVIDEVYNYFDPRDFNAPDRKLWISFLKISRHFHMDFVLIGQSGKTDIDKKILACVDNAVIHKSLIKLQWGFQLLCLITGKWFLAVTWACQKGMPRVKLGAQWVHLKQSNAGRYDTHHTYTDSTFARILARRYETNPEEFSKPFTIDEKEEEPKKGIGDGGDKQCDEKYDELTEQYIEQLIGNGNEYKLDCDNFRY